MKKRKLGNTDIEIAPLIFGGNVFGWTADENKSFRLLDLFFENGFNCVDTADGYSYWVPGNKGGESETIIGNWLRKTGKRKDMIIATKVGWEMGPEKRGLSKKYILTEVETSLKRLQTDYIDLYQSHIDDLNAPIDETLEAYEQLIKEGKVRSIGASNFSANRLEESLLISKQRNLPEYKTFQPKYNLYDREFEAEYSEVVKKYNLSVITYASLGSGFLSGKYQSEKDFSKSPRGGGMAKYLNEKGFAILKSLKDLTAKYNCSHASVALAWLIQNPLVTAPIVSATSESQLNELMKSTKINLSKEDIELLNKAGTSE
ncbi:MAG: aldo/keto reductase [Candidatus Pedobacter colombiensis]|uniref:Aldo/keto reductase n=1 Tax=Candidatus Pedobacter colombiensis TaxID=3121371 RepID=A0AAJ6B829_9SPHI|nr:aldo/keto reductase [Pedobacter sp.]WEK20910.1 MAG: aldo/keto reductase [Pedobacter sp.]